MEHRAAWERAAQHQGTGTARRPAAIQAVDIAFDNNGNGGHAADWGFTNNSNPASMTCRGCGAWNNKGGSFQVIGHTGDVAMPAGITSAKAAAAKRNADGSLPAITSL